MRCALVISLMIILAVNAAENDTIVPTPAATNVTATPVVTSPNQPPGPTPTSSVTVTGYITDLKCWNNNGTLSNDGVNLSTSPQSHGAACMLHVGCIASGYAILTKPEGGAVYTPYCYLDAASNDLVVTFLRSLPVDRTDIYVRANGVLSTNKTFTVQGPISDLVATPTPTTATSAPNATSTPSTTAVPLTTVTGYLTDLKCWNNNGTLSNDGANLSTSPQSHGAACMLHVGCIASGYAILTKPEGSAVYTPYCFLDAASNDLVVTFLRSLPVDRNNIYIRVNGVLANNKTFTLQGPVKDLISTPTPNPTVRPPTTPSPTGAKNAPASNSGDDDPPQEMSAVGLGAGLGGLALGIIAVVMMVCYGRRHGVHVQNEHEMGSYRKL